MGYRARRLRSRWHRLGYFQHDHARWRAFRWSEDGLAGLCDREQRQCLALGLWNGRDPILKERAFGLVNYEGNHGEDVKEYWWYLDALPDHSWLRWRYHYPQVVFPYGDLVTVNERRGGAEPEYELLDTSAFGGGYWICEVAYAQVDLDDIVMQPAGPCLRRAGDAGRVHKAKRSGPGAAPPAGCLPVISISRVAACGS